GDTGPGGCWAEGGPGSADRAEGDAGARRARAPVPEVGGDGEWCWAGRTAPVRVNVGGRMTGGRRVLRGAPEGVPAGAFPPYSGGQSGTLLTTRAYVDLAESIVSVRRRRAAGTPRPAVGGRARTGCADRDRRSTRHGSDARSCPSGGPAPAPHGRPSDQVFLRFGGSGRRARGGVRDCRVTPVRGRRPRPPGGWRAVTLARDGGGGSGAPGRAGRPPGRAGKRPVSCAPARPGPARAGPGRRARPSGPLRMRRPGVLMAAGPARPPHRWNEPPQALPHVRNQPC